MAQRLLAEQASRAQRDLSPGPQLIEEVATAGLRGRGGASFPTAIKLRSVSAQRGPRWVMVNAAEGEPLSAKDRVLIERSPQLVLEGALAAASAIDAKGVVFALREDAVGAQAALRGAVAAADTRLRLVIESVPRAYLAGEESALIRYLGGGPLKPAVTPPLPHERGLRGRPTLVQNVETVAHIALIARHGAEWFRACGTADDPGTALVTVAGAVRDPGVQEIAVGERLGAVLAGAGGAREPLRAVLIGGFHGTWIDMRSPRPITLDDRSLHKYGAALAAGVVVALGASACPVREVSETVRWLAGESAHQCGPCSNGLPAIAELLAALADGRAPRDAGERLTRWSAQMLGRGACKLPDGAMRFLASALALFGSELADHARHGPCAACSLPLTLAPGPPAARLAA